VFEATAEAVPVIAAVDVLKDNPAGKEPALIEYVIVSPSASVAAAEESVYEERVLSKIVPNEPAEVIKAGATWSAEIPFTSSAERPEPFVILTV
jgi:hypothetical protein